jgi:hypothetical protein
MGGHSESLGAGQSDDRISVEARFYAPVQTSLEVHPASSTMGNEFLGGKAGQSVALTTQV